MSEKLAKVVKVMKVYASGTWWVILDCGHWFEWKAATGKKPKVGGQLPCAQPHRQ